jgi:hypothetical protein
VLRFKAIPKPLNRILRGDVGEAIDQKSKKGVT